MSERRVPVTVEAVARAPIALTFDTIMPIDLASIFERRGVLPGVTGVRGQTGPWASAGQRRTVLLSDGGEMTEALTAVDRPDRFAYDLTPARGPLKALVADIRGEWEFFGDEADGQTTVRWTYAFAPRSAATAPLVRHVLARLWRPYAAAVLDRAVRAAEQRAATGAAGPAAS
ncbi:MAG TPA: SRPBCC family protein [Capillimicrobium sp.]